MAQAARLNLRMQKELKLLLSDPPPAASFPFLTGDSDLSSLSTIDAHIEGPEGTVYAKGIFHIKVQIPDRYPFQPPIVTFATPIYHPNIDNGGRICLDILNLPPKGAWQPSLNISTVLTSIGLLLSEPNPDDGLMCEVSREYKYNRHIFDQKARAMTEKYANAEALNHSWRNESVQTNMDLSATVEDKQSDEGSKHEACSSHSKPCRINRQLSLAPSRSTDKQGSKEEANEVPNPPSLDYENMRTKIEREDLSFVSEKHSLSCEALCGSGTMRKLPLDSSVEFHKRNSHDEKDGDPKHLHSLCNGGSVSMDSLESQLLCQVSQKMQCESSDVRQTSDGNNEKMLMNPAISTGQHHSNSSANQNQAQNTGNSVDILASGAFDAKCKKTCPVRTKLSLGFRGLPKEQKNDNKENVLPMNKSPFWCPKSQRKTEILRNRSLGPPTQLQVHSGELVIDESQKQKSNEEQTSKFTKEIKQWGEELPIAGSVIVLDSEDSEEETNGTVRSKQAIVRKRMGKRKAQA